MIKTEGLMMLTIAAALASGPDVIHPVVIWDSDNTVLVDAGLPGQLPSFRDAAQKAGITLDRLNSIIITHSDMDHIGGLRGFTEAFPQAEVLAHAEEKPYIQADMPPVVLSRMEAVMALPGGSENVQLRALCGNLKANYKSLGVKVSRTITDGEELPYGGGVEVIFTHGHTPGHICLYHGTSRTLISGDLLHIEGGKLLADFSFVPQIPSTEALKRQALEKLMRYDIETVICYHGGRYEGCINEAISELLK